VTKIVDPDQLNQATEVVFDKTNKTIQLLVAGNLNDTAPGRTSGVTGQAVYSFCKEEWLTDATLNELKFPFDPIFEQKLVLTAGWSWEDAQSVDLLRDVGWAQVDGAEFAGLQSLGNFSAGTEQAYYQQVAGFDATADASVADFDKTGEINEAVQVVGAGGTPDYSGFLKVFLRAQGKTYAQGELVVDQALSAVDYRFYGVPLTNANDITDGSGAPESDANIDSQSPYTGMTVDYLKGAGFTQAAQTSYSIGDVVRDGVGRWAFCTGAGTITGGEGGAWASFTGTATWEAFAGEVQIGASYYAFNRIIDGNGGTTKEIYEWAQRQLRKTTDINDDTLGSPNQNGNGAQYGRIANSLAYFVGDVLHSADGVAITNFDANYTNNIRQHDITVDGGGLDAEGLPVTSTQRNYPFVAAGNLVFSQNLVDEADVDTLYKMFFEYSVRETATDVALTSSSGPTTTMTSTTIDLSGWAAGEFMYVQGFTANPTNNGMYYATGTPSANSIDLVKVDGITVVDATAGDTVTLDHDPFDSPDAIVVQDNSTTDITGQITAGTIAFDFDYTNNAQGGRTPNSPADVAVIATGIGGARWGVGYFQITAATGLNFPVNVADELVYSNP
jgi:hypothetical protein